MPQSLYDFYNSVFETVLADTEALKQECYRVRHTVYCEEMGTEISTSTRTERDAYDDHAVHGLLRHKETQSFVGTVRLVRQQPPSRRLPLHALCVANNLVLPELHAPEKNVEVSRFCIIKSFRRRLTDSMPVGSGVTDEVKMENQSRIIPSMSLGLMNAMHRLARQHDFHQYSCAMEPFLIKLLSKLGIHFYPIGALVDYHGKRQVCYSSINALMDRVRQERTDVWDVITEKGRYP